MPSLANVLNTSRRFSILQYGESGAGKSIRAASAWQFGPVYFFDFDNKIESVRAFYERTNPKALELIHFDSYSDLAGKVDAAERARKKLAEIEKLVEQGSPPYATIVIDSWTGWEIVKMNQHLARNPEIKRVTVVGSDGRQHGVAGLQDYMVLGAEATEFVQRLTGLPINTIVNCHIRSDKDKVTERIENTLAATGKLSKTLPKFFLETHRVFADGKDVRVQVKTSSSFTANTTLDPKLVDTKGCVSSDLSLFVDRAFKLVSK